jgi:phosphoribosylformylglycinamidine synthase
MSIDGNSRYVYLDPKTGGSCTVAEAARNVVCSGGRPLAITDGLNFGNPEKPEIFWQLEQAVSGMSEACSYLNLPVVGGNVSLYNETEGEAVYPTPVVGAVGLIEDNAYTTSQFFQKSGDVLFLLGETKEELGGGAYQQMQTGKISGMPPELDLEKERQLQQAVLENIRRGNVVSAHDLSHGGLSLALLTSCTEQMGISVVLKSDLRPDVVLFSESQSRILLSVSEEKESEIVSSMLQYKVPCVQIGKVVKERFEISFNGTKIIYSELNLLRDLWQNAIAMEMEFSV